MSNFSVSLGTGSAANCDKPNVPRGVVDPSFPIAVIVRTPFSGRPCPAYLIAGFVVQMRMIQTRAPKISPRAKVAPQPLAEQVEVPLMRPMPRRLLYW